MPIAYSTARNVPNVGPVGGSKIINSYDSFMPLESGGYFHGDGKSLWREVSHEDLADLLRGDDPPLFRTILARHGEDEYSGPFYADFDGETLKEVIDQFRGFLNKIVDHDVSLGQCRIFATGGRGFHIEIPAACFMSAPAPVVNLPRIYREIAYSLYVDTLDMRVYSQGKGRMWRVPNIKRSNGAYKVCITPDEIMSMTPDVYERICSAPREFVPLEAPMYNGRLAALFVKHRDALHAKAKRIRTTAKVEGAIKSRFGGSLPPSLMAVCSGAVRSPAGFNLVAMQVCMAAHAVGMDEGELLCACSGLIERHESDGRRYHTPRKRADELRRMFHYTMDNDAYSFSVSGIRAILPHGVRTHDLRGL